MANGEVEQPQELKTPPTQTAGGGEGGEPSEEPPTTAVTPKPEDRKPREVTDSAKEYLAKAYKGNFQPEKNADFQKILLENGFTQDEINSNSADQLVQMLGERSGMLTPEPTEAERRAAENAAGGGGRAGDGGREGGGGRGPEEQDMPEGERPPGNWGDDIRVKLINFYIDIKVQREQAERRVDAWLSQRPRDVALPEDEPLFNSAGFLQEIIAERIKELEPVEHGPNLTTEQSEAMRAALRTRLDIGGDLRWLILKATESTLDPRLRSNTNVRNVAAHYRVILDEILEQRGSIENLQVLLNSKMFGPMHELRDTLAREARGFSPYKSINEIVNDIMIQTAGVFARGGKYALVKTENGKEILQEANLLWWLRDRLQEFHESDVDNPVDMFSRITIEGVRETALGKWVLTPGWFKDKDGEMHEGLKNQMYMELWLFNRSRDFDASYRKIMGDDAELPKALQQLYYTNTFTKEGTLDRILTLPSVGKTIDFKNRDSIRKSSQEVGQALRLAILTYYNLGDIAMLNDIEEQLVETGGDRQAMHFQSVLFNNEAFIDAYMKKERDKGRTPADIDDTTLRNEAASKIAKQPNDIFNAEGGIDKDKLDKFMELINPFDIASKDFDLKNATQERVRFMIMQNTGLSYEEAKYAETFAFSMARWTGLAARHDYRPTRKTGYTAYDSWTKVLETEQYRIRQSTPDQGGIHGNIYSVGGFKRMGVDFLIGARDIDGRSILEIIQGGEGENINLTTRLEEIKFGDRTMEKFGTDHIARVFKLYEAIITTQEFSFDKVVTIDQWGRVVFDPKAANEWIDNYLKAMRYAYRTWAGTDYSKLIRARDKDGEMRTVSVAESLWGRQVYRDYIEDKLGKRLEEIRDPIERSRVIGETIQDEDNRQGFWKRPMMYAIAAEIYAHRAFESGYPRYKLAQIEKIYEWLENFSGELETDETDLTRTKRKTMFFSKEDIQWIRRASNTTKGWLLFSEATSQGGVGMIEGLGRSFKAFFKGFTG